MRPSYPPNPGAPRRALSQGGGRSERRGEASSFLLARPEPAGQAFPMAVP
ncbi:MAG: hypothetical protein K0S45_3316 [Nitrospira sp.]|nr:hypothetical protein [Nitrospira sp.]